MLRFTVQSRFIIRAPPRASDVILFVNLQMSSNKEFRSLTLGSTHENK